MISLLSMMINAITTAFIYVLKAFFSLLTWFLKLFINAIKKFYVVLPVTSILFILLFFVNIFILFTGKVFSAPDIPETFDGAQIINQEADQMLEKNVSSTAKTFSELTLWWYKTVYIYKGSSPYIPLLILTILMFVPVVAVLLCITVFSSFGTALFVSVAVDAAIYLIRAITGATFVKQALNRYYRLFPEAGRRHREKNYDRWLRDKEREITKEKYGRKRKGAASFYDEAEEYDDSYDEEYDEEYDEGYDDGYDEEYDDGYDDLSDNEDYIEEDYEEDYRDDEVDEDYGDEYEDDYEDDYDDPRDRRRYYEDADKGKPSSASSFDFFAGCTSRESVDKKYRSLVKLYHPDNMDGDTAALQEINAQYAEAKKRF